MRRAFATLVGSVLLCWQCAAMAVHIDPLPPPPVLRPDVTKVQPVVVQPPPVQHPDVTDVQHVPTVEPPTPETPPQETPTAPPPETAPAAAPPTETPTGSVAADVIDEIFNQLHVVPKVVGKSVDDAEAEIRRFFVPVHAGSERSNQPAGTVIRQKPKGGLALEGSQVKYWLSSGTDVPNIVGLKADQAARVLRDAGYAMGTRTLRESDREAGTVLAQKPQAGTQAPAGTQVAVAVSAIADAIVPDVVGMKQQAAVAALGEARLRAQAGTQRDSPEPAGEVLATQPTAGTKVKPGTTVRFDLASGRNRVPNVVGSAPNAASGTLERAGFRLGEQTQPEGTPTNRVVRQRPAAGASAALGTRVAVVMGSTEEPPVSAVIVPDVVGHTQADADRLIDAAMLAPLPEGTVDGPDRRGVVVRTDPTTGTQVNRGSAVRYWLASGRNQVPRLEGLSRARAENGAGEAGFRLGKVGTRVDASHADRVLTQTPAVGALLDVGSPIDIVMGIAGSRRVPDVRNLTEAEARAKLRAEGFAPATKKQYTLADDDHVVAQFPAPATSVAIGGTPTVTITVSQQVWQAVAASSFLLATLLAGTWWHRYRPWPFQPFVQPNARIELEDGATSEQHVQRSTPRDVRIRVELEDGETPPPTAPLSARRKEIRYD